MRTKKIKALLIVPGMEVQVIKIPANMKFIRAFLGGELYRYKLDSNTVIIGNKSTAQDSFNRFYKGNIIIGSFLVVSVKKGRRVSMRKREIRKYSNLFKLNKHKKKVDALREEYLENYYFKQHLRRIKNKKQNREIIFKKAA